MPKVTIDPIRNEQVYGRYRYNTELGTNGGKLSIYPKYKQYPKVLSRGRSETSILDAIANYEAEQELCNSV